MNKKNIYRKGFTVIELVISVAIFAFMTALLVAKYGTFNQGILLTNLAYDVALTIKNSQSYALDVKSQPDPNSSQNFSTIYNYPYGVHFDTSAQSDSNNTGNPFNKEIVFFSDFSPTDKLYSGVTEKISFNDIKRGSYISAICVGDGSSSAPCATPASTLDITFKRPDPDAIIRANGDNVTRYPYAQITLMSSDNGVRKVVVRSTGEIEIVN